MRDHESPEVHPSHPLFTRYGFARTGDTAAPLTIEPYPAICTNGALRATVVASAVDLVGGLHTRAIAGTDATFTSDLSIRIPRPDTPEALVARGETLRVGRRLITTRVVLSPRGPGEEAGTDACYALGETTFTRISRPPEEAPDIRRLSLPESIPRHPLDRPLDEAVGVHTVDATRGRVELPLRSGLLNPEGVMQGALVALVVECAALSIAAEHAGEQAALTELDLRYLASASVGPVYSQASWIGPAAERMLRVELRDAGREDRLTATALVRIADRNRAA
jgi:acyl-coenzyme A thioesterase PaaI-like protein